MTVYQEREAQRTILLRSLDQGASWTPVYDPTAPSEIVVEVQVTDPLGAPISIGDGKAYFRVPSLMDGWILVEVAAALVTPSSSGTPTLQFHNTTQGVDMLSTPLTIDANETDSTTAATAAVINVANRTVTTADILRVDIDVAGTGAAGLIVSLSFQAT